MFNLLHRLLWLYLLVSCQLPRSRACSPAVLQTVANTDCSAIPTSTSTAGSSAPSITYSSTNTDGTHPTSTIAVISCTNLGSSTLLMAQSSTTPWALPIIATCTNGAWSNSNTFTCVTGCPDFNCDHTLSVSYTNGHESTTHLSLPGATATVTCANGFTNQNLYEGTDTSYASPFTSSLTYTCSTSGQWQRGGTTQTGATCLQNCEQESIPISNPTHSSATTAGLNYIGPMGTATQSTGQTFTPNIFVANNDAAVTAAAIVPCVSTTVAGAAPQGPKTGYTVEIVNTSGSTVTSATLTSATLTLTCYDGSYNATINGQAGRVVQIACVGP